jgi:predicted Rossmann-fold nucleotide-binding protein
MRAANEGAAEANSGVRRQSLGIRVALPFEQEANAFVTQLYEHRTFFTRLHHFVLASDAFVITPGGIGTVLESMMVWQLLQVGHIERAPLIFVGRMWSALVEWAREYMLDPRLFMAASEELSIPRCVGTADEAIALIRDDHSRWRRLQEG